MIKSICSAVVTLCMWSSILTPAVALATDESSAFETVKLRAEAGDASAMVILGGIYAAGKQVKKDEKKAFYWFEKAGYSRSAAGAYATGLFLMEGKGTAANPIEGCKWFWVAANFGHKEAILAMVDANILSDGRCMPISEMHNWLQRAVDSKHPPAFSMLGEFLENGAVGYNKDADKALNLYRQGAELGDTKSKQALIRLGKQ